MRNSRVVFKISSKIDEMRCRDAQIWVDTVQLPAPRFNFDRRAAADLLCNPHNGTKIIHHVQNGSFGVGDSLAEASFEFYIFLEERPDYLAVEKSRTPQRRSAESYSPRTRQYPSLPST